MLKQEDKIFKNLYNDLGWEIDNSIKRDDWKDTKNLISKGRDWIINEVKTSELRGRENFFAEDYEKPTDKKHLSIDTGTLTIEESTNEILNVYRKMAAMAPRP